MIKNIFQMLLALLVAFCGSLIFIYLHLPLPWLLGSIFATSILIRFQKIPIQSPKLLINIYKNGLFSKPKDQKKVEYWQNKVKENKEDLNLKIYRL
jgi:hypothetical protein